MAQSKRIDTGAQPDSPSTPGWFTRLRQKHAWLDHIVRAIDAYAERYGAHYAAAITYFSVLSLAPVLLLAFSVLGFFLVGNHDLVDVIKDRVATLVPGGLLSEQTIDSIIKVSVDKKGLTAIVGIVVALYTGVSWMGNLRNALTAQWGIEKPEQPFFPTLLKDLLALLGLAAALVVSFSITALLRAFNDQILAYFDVADTRWAQILLQGLGIVLSIASSFLVFLWVLARLPRKQVEWRTALKGALVVAIGFEVLKQAMAIYVQFLGSSPAFVLFGPVLGLMLFANFVSQLLLFVTAWIATAKENREIAVPEPGVLVRPVLGLYTGPSLGQAAKLLGVGALFGALLRSRRR